VIAILATAEPLWAKAGLGEADKDAGVIALAKGSVASFIKAAAAGRIWDREPMVRAVP